MALSIQKNLEKKRTRDAREWTAILYFNFIFSWKIY